MKKISKILSVLLIIMMLCSIASNVLATGYDPGQFKGDTSKVETTGINDFGNKIVGVIQVVGSLISVVVLIILGIKYMMGSAQEKAEYKKTMIPYLIGAVVVFAASNIAGVVFNLSGTFTPPTTTN